MTSLLSGTSSGLTTARRPWRARWSIMSWLWMMGPSITQGSPDRAAPSASSTARRTP